MEMKTIKKFIIFVLIFGSTQLLNAKGFEVNFNQPGNSEYELNFNLGDYKVKTITIKGTTYTKIVFEGSAVTTKTAYAELPFIHATVQLPDDKNITAKIVSTDYIEYKLDYPLLPSRGVIYRNQNPDTIPYKIDEGSISDKFYPGEIAQPTEPFILRDIRGTNVYVYPFQYNSEKQILRVYKNVTVKLIENNTTPVNPIISSKKKITREMNSLYRTVFINYDLSKFDHELADFGSILVIRTFYDEIAIAPYIQWKREKGFTVYEEEVDPGNNVTSLVSDQYNLHNDILYVQLVGDWADIQGPEISWGFPQDPFLGCVVGNDEFPDLIVARFCANYSAQVTTQVNKTITYERDPEIGGTWYATATGIGSTGGPADDEPTDWEHIEVIWNYKLEPFTYETYNPIYDPGANVNMVVNAVNAGTGIINYAGHGSEVHWGTSGFGNNYMMCLSNGNKLPFIVSVSCSNGSFHNTECLAEAWLHKENGGAVGMYASTTVQPFQIPTTAQDYFNDLLIGGYDYSLYPDQNGISTDVQKTSFGALCLNGSILMALECGGVGFEVMSTWTIFGDASLQVRTASPALLTLSNEVVIMGMDFTTIVTTEGNPVEGAIISLSQDDNYFMGITDEFGSVTISHSLFAGDAKMVVTGFNTETIYEDITVITGGVSSIEGTVSLEGGTGNVENVVITAGFECTNPDASGFYSINIEPGINNITATLENYIPFSDTVTVLSGQTSVVDIVLFSLDFLAPPENLTYNNTGDYLYWEPPQTILDWIAYNVYRDYTIMATIPDTSSIIFNPSPGIYFLTAIYEYGESVPSNIVEVTTVGTEDRLQVQNIKLNNYPNPFKELTVISYTLKVSGRVNIEIYDMSGQQIRTLVNENKTAGVHSVVWDGTDELGESVGSGIYFCKLNINNKPISTKKIMFIM